MTLNLNIFTLFSLIAFSRAQLGLHNLGASIPSQIEDSLNPLKNLQDKIKEDVDKQLVGVEKLKQEIEEKVSKDLESVRILESLMKIRSGIEGVTVATFVPGGRQLIIRNEKYYSCNGVINENIGKCSGVLEEYELQSDKDFCFITSKNVINDWYCIAAKSNFRIISYVNGEVMCETEDDSPKLLVKADEFDDMCKNVATAVNYKYFTDSPLEHVGNGVTCSTGEHQICSYTESLVNGGNFQVINTEERVMQ